MIYDATARPQDIAYPTDLDLLSSARERPLRHTNLSIFLKKRSKCRLEANGHDVGFERAIRGTWDYKPQPGDKNTKVSVKELLPNNATVNKKVKRDRQ